MKKNKASIPFTFSALVVLFLVLAGQASAQWSVPYNIFNLPNDFDRALVNLTNWLLGFAGLLGTIALIWGGLNYMFSSGDAQKIDLSKKVVYYALMGMAIAGVSYAIIQVIVGTIFTI
ncbi:MAG: TrbC/VirB2 family protein [Candidatus Pacebacteria bacterium]|nr:TrbC/VirB2 family protein [Candidatus Paceibacterota bacterium]